MSNDELKLIKESCKNDLIKNVDRYADRLNDIDARLYNYVLDCIDSSADHANMYELLGIRKVLRLMDTYIINSDRVRKYIRAIEGIWGNRKHISGGLKFSTPRGHKHVQLMPYQVWCLFGIYAFDTYVDMLRPWDQDEDHLQSEFEKDGNVWDRRRLCTEAHIFQTRKSGKTEFGAAIDFLEANIFGDYNAQVLICCNSKEQAKIAYKAVRQFCYQIDPDATSKAGGKYLRVTADEMTWLPNQPKAGEIKVMSAGGKTKDGLYASLVHADEHGSAAYVANHSDMQSLVDVCVGSMGPRRERLLLHTTTAGITNYGPYQVQLEAVEELLINEMAITLGQPCQTDEDKWFAFDLRLDPWEVSYDLDQLNNDALFRKVNRSIGTTVQPTWYRDRLHEARGSEDTRKEVLTKDFNIWQTGRVTAWMQGDRIRPLQRQKTILDCKYSDGWGVFVGLDFSHGDDLFAITYLAVNYQNPDPKGRFFCDTEAWVLEETMKNSPNRSLYELWQEEGWLNVCPGEVFDSSMAMAKLAEKTQNGVNMIMFGYDPAQSVQPINNLKAWLQSLGVDGQTVVNMVLPVGQSSMTQNPRVSELEDLIKSPEGLMEFSNNPLWPWCFGNCMVELNSADLRRVLKSGPNAKIDPVAGLIDALYCFDLSEGRVEK